MTRSVSAKLLVYAGFAGTALVAALAVRLEELVVLAAPFALLPVVSLALVRRPRIGVSFELESERALEGDELEARIALDPAVGVHRLEVLLELPRGLHTADGHNPAGLQAPTGRRSELVLKLACKRWGGYRLGRIHLRGSDAFGFVSWEWTVDLRRPLKVYPREEDLRRLLRPLETQVFSGNHVARQKGEGIEFADLREFVPGDRVRHVNWRASARRGQLWVNERHAERNADVVLFIDTFAEATTADGESTLDRGLRAAASLTARYLEQKDRVGFVTFGGMLNWLLPSSGTVQLYRLVDALIDTQIVLNYAWRDIDVIPRRTLPPKATVIALSTLLDERAIGALLDLRARGFDLVLVEISPAPFLAEPSSPLRSLGRRTWELQRQALRGRFREAGVPVAVWDDERSLAAGLEEVTAFRRRARVVSA